MKTMMKIMITILALGTVPAWADLRVFACEPEWAALADEIGGDKVETWSATTAFQDPHCVQARPSIIARVRRADLVICTGANLEIGWLPVLLRQASNPSVNPGTDGFIEASLSVEMLDAPAVPDRAAGDIHPYGNPHIQTDPRNIAKVAEVLYSRMKALDADNAGFYESRYRAFAEKWERAIADWEQKAAAVEGMKIVVHHAAWVYMERWLGLDEVGQMEPKPGLPPSASHLAKLLADIENRDVKLFIRTAYQSPRAAEWLSERTDVPGTVIPHTVGATDGATDLFGLFDDMIARLLEHGQ
ncbi:MAG: zinc ABC transporter substrate-binding protein [Pseudomonadales bacterium]|nr:zinc ABC transporter substrate-binding protein [Pseudomonadales bacterium]